MNANAESVTANVQSENADVNADVNENETNDAPKLEDVKRTWFPLNSEESVKAFQAEFETMTTIVAADDKLKVEKNFDADVPNGYGVFTGPLTRTESGEQKNVGLFCIAVPSMETILDHDKGEEFVRRTVANKLAATAIQSIKTKAATRPATVHDFIVSTRSTAESLAGYRKVAGRYVAGMRERGMPEMSDALLRQLLSSQPFASKRYPEKPEAFWNHLLDLLIAAAEGENKPAGIMTVWKDTRNVAKEAEAVDITLDDLDAIAAGDDDESEATDAN